jgi:hypothetical protein
MWKKVVLIWLMFSLPAYLASQAALIKLAHTHWGLGWAVFLSAVHISACLAVAALFDIRHPPDPKSATGLYARRARD